MTKPEEARSALRVGVGVSVAAPWGKVQLYCNPATSEVSGEHSTLHEAIASNPAAHPGDRLICDGIVLAAGIEYPRGWFFERAGIERLIAEFNCNQCLA